MKILILLLTLLGSMYTISVEKTHRKFRNSLKCEDFSLNKNIIQAKCQRNDSSWIFTRTNVNMCLGQINGTLTQQTDGNFTNNCRGCRVRDNVKLTCVCYPDSQGGRPTAIDLRTFLYTVHGHLVCEQNPQSYDSWMQLAPAPTPPPRQDLAWNKRKI